MSKDEKLEKMFGNLFKVAEGPNATGFTNSIWEQANEYANQNLECFYNDTTYMENDQELNNLFVQMAGHDGGPDRITKTTSMENEEYHADKNGFEDDFRVGPRKKMQSKRRGGKQSKLRRQVRGLKDLLNTKAMENDEYCIAMMRLKRKELNKLKKGKGKNKKNNNQNNDNNVNIKLNVT